jgi:hypothetical protein
MKQHETDPFNSRAKELLDESIDNLDGETQRRLKQARLSALEVTRPTTNWLVWAPASAVAAGLMAVVIYLNQAQPPLPPIFQDPVQQTVAENMELLDDLEFVAWLVLEERI